MTSRNPTGSKPRECAPGLDEFASSIVKCDEAHDRKRRIAYSRACQTAMTPIMLYGLYFAYRVRCLAALHQWGKPEGIARSIAFLLVELCFFGEISDNVTAIDGTALIYAFAAPLLMDCAAAIAAWQTLTVRPKLKLLGDAVPSVDVFITCRNEPVAILMDTLKAACALDYPSSRYRIMVLDDGNSREVRDAVDRMETACVWAAPPVWYSTRGAVLGGHAKKYNMQHGLEVSSALPGGSGAVAAFLDVDMIPDPCWLRVTIAHLVGSPKVGLVNPPQDFYNLDENTGIPPPLDWLFQWYAILLDSLGISLCTGSGIVIRRSALDQIGGFLTHMQQEDVAIPKALQAAGWRSVQINDNVQCGLMPEGLWGQVRQRKQWIRGWLDDTFTSMRKETLQVRMRAFNELLFGLTVYFLPAIVALGLASLTLFGYGSLLIFRQPTDARWSGTLFLLARISAFYFGLHKAKASSWKMNAFDHRIDSWLWPLLPDVIFAGMATERRSTSNQNYRTAGAVGFKHDKKERVHLDAWRFYAVVIALTGAGCYGLATATDNARQRQPAWFLRVPPQAVEMHWATISSMLPIILGLSRKPTHVQRESLLLRDSKSGVAYPLSCTRHRTRTTPSFGLYHLQIIPLLYAVFYWLDLVIEREWVPR